MAGTTTTAGLRFWCLCRLRGAAFRTAFFGFVVCFIEARALKYDSAATADLFHEGRLLAMRANSFWCLADGVKDLSCFVAITAIIVVCWHVCLLLVSCVD